MDEIERFYRHTRKRRQQKDKTSRGQPRHQPQSKSNAVAAKRRKIKAATGLNIGMYIGCGSTDFLDFQLDHIVGRKHDDTLWAVCTRCHERKTDMLYEEPPVTDDPRNPFEVIGRWLISIAQYIDLVMDFLKMLRDKLRKFGELCIEAARKGHGRGLVLPA